MIRSLPMSHLMLNDVFKSLKLNNEVGLNRSGFLSRDKNGKTAAFSGIFT